MATAAPPITPTQRLGRAAIRGLAMAETLLGLLLVAIALGAWHEAQQPLGPSGAFDATLVVPPMIGVGVTLVLVALPAWLRLPRWWAWQLAMPVIALIVAAAAALMLWS